MSHYLQKPPRNFLVTWYLRTSTMAQFPRFITYYTLGSRFLISFIPEKTISTKVLLNIRRYLFCTALSNTTNFDIYLLLTRSSRIVKLRNFDFAGIYYKYNHPFLGKSNLTV